MIYIMYVTEQMISNGTYQLNPGNQLSNLTNIF